MSNRRENFPTSTEVKGTVNVGNKGMMGAVGYGTVRLLTVSRMSTSL